MPIHKWDYTRPDLVQATYDLGRRDGERFVLAQRTSGDAAPHRVAWPAGRAPHAPIESP